MKVRKIILIILIILLVVVAAAVLFAGLWLYCNWDELMSVIRDNGFKPAPADLIG